MDLKSAHVLPSGNIITPAGRLSYPSLFVARTMKGETDKTKAKYGTTLLLPKAADLKVLQDAVLACVQEKWGKDAKKIRSPFLKTAEKMEDDEMAEEFPTLIRCTSSYKPDVIYANGAACEDEEGVYPGRWARISVRPYAWEHPANGKGVGLGLQNVQLLDHAERIGGGRMRAEEEFTPVEVEGGSARSSDSIFA